MQPDARYRLVLDPEDRIEATEFLQTLASTAEGRVLVTITPGGNNLHWLARDVATGLGKRHDVSGTLRNAQETWEQAAVWLVAGEARDLIVSRAHLLNRGGWERLLELAASCQLTLWLIAQATSLRRGQREAVRDWPITVMDYGDFLSQWGETQPAARAESMSTARAKPISFPPVPLADFTSFRSECAKVLDRDDFDRVDACFWAAFDSSSRLFAEDQPDELGVAEHLRELVDGCPRRAELITRVRGAQTAAFRAGYLVRVDVERLLTHWSGGDSQARKDEALGRLREYSQPRLAAAGALTIAAQLQPQELIALNLADVSSDGSHVTVGGAAKRIDGEAQVLLRGQWISRVLAGADAGDPLFAYLYGGGAQETSERGIEKRWTRRGVQQALRKIGLETGLVLTAHWRRYGSNTTRTWLGRHGVAVTSL